MALEGRLVSSKSPSRVRDGDEGAAGRNAREQCFPDEGSLICPPGKSMIFDKKETEKNLSQWPDLKNKQDDTKPDVYRSNLLENYDAILPDFSPPPPVKRKKQPKVKEKSAPASRTLAFQPTDVYDRFLFNTREQVILLPRLIIFQIFVNTVVSRFKGLCPSSYTKRSTKSRE